MMKWKGKVLVEEHVEKLVKKKPMSKVKENQKMLQWIKMDSNKLKWARQDGLESLFNLQWTTPKEDLLRNFLRTWETKEDGRILGQVRGQEILIDHVLIHEKLGISKEGTIDVTNATLRKLKPP
jgi:hypothetical protein